VDKSAVQCEFTLLQTRISNRDGRMRGSLIPAHRNRCTPHA
jgi:hypothetical protein